MSATQETAIIIGAGPAGLTAAYELLQRTQIKPTVLEATTKVAVFKIAFLVGRNGMHRYDNQDHSMLTAMTAVDNILNGVKAKRNIWEVNTEQEYHE